MIVCKDVYRIFKSEGIEVAALTGLTLSVRRGEYLAILGNSGSGKSTLLNMLGGLDTPTAGKLIIENQDMSTLTHKQMLDYRRHTVGFVWQNPARNLVSYLSAIENVELAMMAAGRIKRGRAAELLELMGLAEYGKQVVRLLSGGQQQRVGLAIALANTPKLLLADEPTSAVDAAAANQITSLFRKLQSEMGLTIVMVTHDTRLSELADRAVHIKDGRIVETT